MGWGSSIRRGGGRKVRALPRKFVFLGLRREESGMSRGFCGMSRTPGGVQKVCANKVHAHFSFPRFGTLIDGERRKPINIKNFGGTPPGLCPVCPVDMSHLSRHLSRLSRPLNVNFHINRPQCPGCPWDVPNLSPGRSRGIPTTKFLYVIVLYRFFVLHNRESATLPSTGTG